jgi:DNA-binding CsgD family transcriptional regulator
MTGALKPGDLERRPVRLHPELADVMRAELPSLAAEIITEIRDTIPEYARPMDGPYGRALRVGVEQALTSFVDVVTNPSASRAHRDEVCRRLGRYEAREGRSLDSLQAAYRVGGRVAWRRVMEVGESGSLSSSTMSLLADAVFGYMNELASLSLEGYLEVKGQSATAREEWRQRLLALILERPAAPRRAITDLAELAGWTVPDEVTPVAIQVGQPCLRPLSDHEFLVDSRDARPHLLLPGAPDVSRQRTLEAALAGQRAAIGLTVPLADAADSLRWARQTLALADTGIIGGGQLIRCEDHLVTLWLLSDSALADQVTRRQFSALSGLAPRQQHKLTETFGAWLASRGTAAEIADRLQVHPQTVRYRIRQLERILGDRFGDPDARFAMELVLRVMRLRERASPGGNAPGGSPQGTDASPETQTSPETDQP